MAETTLSRPVTIGVAGGTGSGKTTVSRELRERVGAQRIVYLPHDGYYLDWDDLPREPDGTVNFDHPHSLETPLMIEHIRQLQQGQAAEIPIYDFGHHRRTGQTQRLEPKPAILVEGILIFAEPELRDLFDIRIYVDTDADIRLIRRIQRDISERGRTVESIIKQYLSTVRPMHLEFVEPSKSYADIIIPRGGHNLVAIEMIAARIRHLVATAPPLVKRTEE
jgi:uridine kinase